MEEIKRNRYTSLQISLPRSVGNSGHYRACGSGRDSFIYTDTKVGRPGRWWRVAVHRARASGARLLVHPMKMAEITITVCRSPTLHPRRCRDARSGDP